MKGEGPAEGATRITTYDRLDRYVRAFAAGSFNLLILVGDPGLQKSRVVRDAMADACWIEGHATAMGIYKRLWEFRDQPIIIDDVNSLYADRAAIRGSSRHSQTDARKAVAWESEAPALLRENIPRRFMTSSRVLIIANAWRTLNEHVTALEDRVTSCAASRPLRKSTAGWRAFALDQEIFDWIGEHLHLVESPVDAALSLGPGVEGGGHGLAGHPP